MVLLSDPSRRNVIRTRSGTEIPCASYLSFELAKMQLNAQEILRWRPRAKLRSIDMYPYNCVGMIFAARRAWIEIDYIYDLLSGDGFRQIKEDDVTAGDLILYIDANNEPAHIGLIIAVDSIGKAKNILVMSKWGKDAEFIHFIEDVPQQMGKPTKFYTDRKEHDYIFA